MLEVSEEDQSQGSSDEYEMVNDEYTAEAAGSPSPGGMNPSGTGPAGELCHGTLKKYAAGNMMNKWQPRFVRVVSYDSNNRSLLLEYSKNQKDFMKGSKVHTANLKAPGIQELNAIGEAQWISKISGDKSLCCKMFVSRRQGSDGKEHKGGPLVFKFSDHGQMEEWKTRIVSHFHLMQTTGSALAAPVPPPPPPSMEPLQPQMWSNGNTHQTSTHSVGDGRPPPLPPSEGLGPRVDVEEKAQMSPAPPRTLEDNEFSTSSTNTSTDGHGSNDFGTTTTTTTRSSSEDNRRESNINDPRSSVPTSISEIEPDSPTDNDDLAASLQHTEAMAQSSLNQSLTVVFSPLKHAQPESIEEAITDAGLGSTMIEIERLSREVLMAHDASGGKLNFVKREALRSWISEKLAEQEMQRNSAAHNSVLPIPRISDAMERSAVHNRHMSGLDLNSFAKMKIEANMAGSDRVHSKKGDIRSSKEKPTSSRGRSHSVAMRQELAANSKTVLQREVIKMSAKAGRMPPEADSVERADLIEDDDQANPDKISVDSDGNWNESFQSAREMPIDEFGSAMEKGMKLHRLRHKIIRLASVAVKTIIDEFALPRRLKKIKPLEWMDDLEGQEQDSRADLNVELEDMPNDLIYQYRSLLIRVLGISASRDDSQTFRKAAGNEVRGIHAFQEACTRVHQDMVARRLEKNGGLSKPIAVRDSPSRNGTSANGVPMLSSPYVTVVDYSGFRVLISTIPPIDEDHTLVHGRTDPQDPNSNFEDFDPAFSALLSAVAQELNLKEHKIIADGSVRIIPLSSEVQGHKCIDTRRYAVNLGRIMPPDLPHGGSDITTKLLRPEFVQAYCMPLSSDAFSSIIMPPQNDSSARLLDDLSGNDVDAGNASKYLRTQRIPEFVAKLDTLAIFPYESHTLTQAMHAHGINMRYLGRICELTKLPHVRELVTIEMLARTCKDVLNENMRKTIIGAHERVAHIIHDLASRGRHLNDEAMAKLLQFNRQLTEDTETNIVDFFNLVLGQSSDHENSLFWKNVLLPRVCEKFHFYHQEHHQKNEQGASDPLCIGREILNPCQLFHAMQYQCGVRFLASEHYDFNGLASPLKMSQIVDVYPKVKSPGNMALEVNRVAAAAEVYRDSGELDTALQAFRLRHNQVKNIDGLSSGIPCALAMNDIANTLRLQYHELRKKRLLYGSDGNASDSQVMLSDRQRLLKALSYTEEALQMVDSTHVVSARIHETRMRIFSDLGDTGELAVEFHTAISAALSHFGRSGMHPYVAELHCILGSLLASHDQIPNARKHLELARKLASRILGPRHLILASYTADVARIDMKDGDTFGAFEHYQQALMLIFQTIGRESLEAANILCEMARIKSMHGRQVGQLEAEEALRLAEQALRIRESCAMEEVGTDAHGSDEKEVLAAMRSDEVTVISALSQVSLSLNDMLVQSYSQVADLASNERRYERATECYERLLTCLRARSVKTEAALKLMQKASQEIIAIRLQGIGSEPAREIRRIHAMHDPHKSIHQKMPELFRQVVSTVSTESPGAYFDDLVTRANVHKNTAARLAGKSTEQTTPSRKISQEELEAERELACLVELSDAV